MRKLASIQEVQELSPIPGADSIETARILGWYVVVKKGQFVVGEPVVYIEPDSILPEKPEFEFLHTSKFRIKTVRLRGQVSQGIAFPMEIAGEDLPIGEDVTERLGIIQYEMPVPAELAGQVVGPWPYYIPKTDESRIQSCPWILDQNEFIEWYATEKLDGSSMTAWKDANGVLNVASRNVWLAESESNSFWAMARKLDLRTNLPPGKCIQGELIGPGTGHGDYLGLGHQEFRVFNAFDIADGIRMQYIYMVEFVGPMGLKPVPYLGTLGSLTSSSVDDLVEKARRTSSALSKKDRIPIEGMVVRSNRQGTVQDGVRTDSFKVLNPDHLMRIGE
jgi:RNA ligase (TIGR02306 family)